jgi:hypothetical protein
MFFHEYLPKTEFRKDVSIDFLPFSKGKMKGFCVLLILNEHQCITLTIITK